MTEEQKLKFKHSECLLLISVGQESHEGEMFASTIELINSSFKSCIIALYDSLQRHTMALNNNKKPEDFLEAAAKQGDLWLARNRKYYSKLTILNDIVRWDKWLNHSNFIKQQKKLIKLINTDYSYKITFDTTVNDFLDRHCKRLSEIELSSFDIERAKTLCFNYLLEECTVLCLWPELNCEFEIYPNRHNDAIEETRKRFVFPYYSNLLQSVRLGFRNAKQVKPQLFELLQQDE